MNGDVIGEFIRRCTQNPQLQLPLRQFVGVVNRLYQVSIARGWDLAHLDTSDESLEEDYKRYILAFNSARELFFENCTLRGVEVSDEIRNEITPQNTVGLLQYFRS